MRLPRRRKPARGLSPRRAAVRSPATRLPGSAARRPRARRRLAGALGTGTPAERTAGRRTNLTTRAAVLAVVLCAVAVTLAYPLREFLSQRSEISRLQQQQRDAVRSVAAMERANRAWSDPAYVKAQARQRLHFMVPGEPAYAVLLPPSTARVWSPVPGGAVESTGPWYGRLWSSVEAAGASSSRR